jgi:hypothetical protein
MNGDGHAWRRITGKELRAAADPTQASATLKIQRMILLFEY